jgi:hypothetical protein
MKPTAAAFEQRAHLIAVPHHHGVLSLPATLISGTYQMFVSDMATATCPVEQLQQ